MPKENEITIERKFDKTIFRVNGKQFFASNSELAKIVDLNFTFGPNIPTAEEDFIENHPELFTDEFVAEAEFLLSAQLPRQVILDRLGIDDDILRKYTGMRKMREKISGKDETQKLIQKHWEEHWKERGKRKEKHRPIT